MGDHFVLLVDRLITESSLEAAIQSKNRLMHATSSEPGDLAAEFSSERMNLDLDIDIGSSPVKLVECRICQDEDEDSNMEVPCSCSGSLKYAHRGCVQRWCNEKGNTICEICHQQFMPGYTSPPPLFHYGGIPMNFRGNWEISRRDLYNPQLIAMVATDHTSLEPDFEDYVAPSPRSLLYCHIVAIIFMVLLVLRHTLPVITSAPGEYSITLFTLLILRTTGVLLPIYIMVRAFTAIQRRRQQQDSHSHSLTMSDEESDLPHLQPQPHFIHVH